MNNVISAQTFKCFRSKAFRIMTLIMIPISVFLTLIFKEMQNSSDEPIPVTGFSMISNGLEGDLLFIFIGILVTLLFTVDFSSGSIRQIIGKGIDRTKFLLGTIVSMTIHVAIMLATSYASLFVSGSLLGEGIGTLQGSNFGRMTLCVIVLGFFYIGFTMCIVTLSRKVSISLITVILMPSMFTLIVRAISVFTKKDCPIDPVTLMSRILEGNLSSTWILVSLVAYFVAGLLLCGASIMLLKKRDM